MVLYMIGLGLGDEDDITVKGLKIVQSADVVYLEAYTSVLEGADVNPERLQKAYKLDKPIKVAYRHTVEDDADELLVDAARTQCIVLLVVGDPVCATTHTDLLLRCRQKNIPFQTIHNASIMGVAGACGLQLYQFGQTISIPFFEENWRPTSFYPKIQYNRKGNMHTLCLLDIKVREPDYDAIMKRKTIQNLDGTEDQPYLPPRFMSVAQAAQQLIETEVDICQEYAYDIHTTLCVGLLRMGQSTQQIVVGTLDQLSKYENSGPPLHSLIITGGNLHDMELEFLKEYMIND
jgi:diphthine methyl ester synthase